MPDIRLRFNRDVIVIEGAMGTMLQRAGIPTSECSEMLNVLDPEVVADIHERYIQAGAQCVVTNTFGGSRFKLGEYGVGDRVEELNRAGVRVAKTAQPQHILGDVGPCGLVLEPLGRATFDEVYAQYFEQVAALALEGPDAILIETMVDIADARCALLAAKDACDLPVIVSCTFNENGRMDLSGTSPATAAVILAAAGADVVGMNCSLGPNQMLPLLEQMAAATTLPLLIQPNAGIPFLDAQGETLFPGTAEEFASASVAFRAAGAQFIGSCCGSTPVFTAAIYASVGDTPVVARPASATAGLPVFASPSRSVVLGPGHPTALVGERINPTGKPALASELEQGSMSLIRQFAEAQEQAGATLLDINVGAPMVDAATVLPQATLALTGFCGCPLVFDTTDPVALEAALRVYPARALINSVNGDPASYRQVLPLAKRYGAGVVVLALDEKGIPATVEERLAIVEAVRTAAHAHGLRDEDLLVDMLVMTAATSAQAPYTTVEGVRRVSERGLGTILGVSNVSHGLPNRPALNAAFVGAAVAAGLSAAIVNPNDPVMNDALTIANANRGTVSLAEALASWDTAYAAAIDTASHGVDKEEPADKGVASAHAPSEAPSTLAEAERLLKRAVLRGDREAAPALIDTLVGAGKAPNTIVDDLLTPTLRELGDAFGRGEAFLPQMMVAAGAMKAAVERIKAHLPATSDEDVAGKVVFCSVKGDVHSIGKDICVALLESQGYKVYDLGVDVAPETVLATAREEDVDIVCLSALMTTTLKNMQETVELIYREEPSFKTSPCKAVMVGGAVVTERWAQSIGAAYSSDAPGCVEAVHAVCAQRG